MGDTSLALLSSSSRYRKQTVQSTLFGPSVDLAGEVYASITDASEDGDLSAEDLEKLKKFLPYQNLFYLRLLLEKDKEKGD